MVIPPDKLFVIRIKSAECGCCYLRVAFKIARGPAQSSKRDRTFSFFGVSRLWHQLGWGSISEGLISLSCRE